MGDINFNLKVKLEQYGLEERVQFDDSALERLKELGKDNWKDAEVYVTSAILDALQYNRPTISEEDINNTDFSMELKLLVAGEDPWNTIKKVASVQGITSEG